MGHYEDKIWCDVIHMNIAHIIIGRPWLFYRKVHHDKEVNTCTLLWNRKGLQLLPIKSTAPPSSTSSPSSEDAQKVQQVEREVLSARKVKTEDITDDIEEQVNDKADFMGTQ